MPLRDKKWASGRGTEAMRILYPIRASRGIRGPRTGPPNDHHRWNKLLAEESVSHLGRRPASLWSAPAKRCPETGLQWACYPPVLAGERWGCVLHAPRRRRFGSGRLKAKAASGSYQLVIRCDQQSLEMARNTQGHDCRRTPKGSRRLTFHLLCVLLGSTSL